ncbi:hypothetical protein BSA145_21325 (plasmid) [Bacillus safensis]|uniref:Uncharacterized protein n=1 Tax=Bacillus safensis TaxID=561879 RepID=A0A1L6ZPH1_BACIA|nr:hypothetical protein [Bacillus safensis]APT48409.1 hypothetical protein BSA145_21325 [Bacillus safensis]
MADTQRTTPKARRRLAITSPHPAGAAVIPNSVENPIRRVRTAFYSASRLLPVDFVDRVALLEQRERILDLAEALLDLADAMDAPLEDREPEPVEAEDDEATLQPVTLAPDWVRPVKVSCRGAILHAFRAPGEPVLPVTYYPPKPQPNEPPEDKPKRRNSQLENSSLATGLRNACLAGTGFWVLVGLAGWGLA